MVYCYDTWPIYDTNKSLNNIQLGCPPIPLGSTPGIWFVCFRYIFEWNILQIVVYSAEPILFPVCTRHWEETRLTQHGVSPEPNLRMVSVISLIKAYIHPNLFVHVINQFKHSSTRKQALEKKLKYHSAIVWSTWKTYSFSRHRWCLALNVGDNGNPVHSHRFTPLMHPCVP